MEKLFADASYWIALVNPRDELHDRAVRVTRQNASAQIVTSEMVLVELLNSFSDAGRLRQAAGEMVQQLRKTSGIKIVAQSVQQFESALSRYLRAADKSGSLTDCASFQIMESEAIQAALTYDQHFVQAGFAALLR